MTRMFVLHTRRCSLVLAAMLLGAATAAQADDPLDIDPAADEIERFTTTRWSMSNPPKDYEGGCVVGFLAFQFSPTGYFTFNNRIHGSWRIDELGNLKLRTRAGQRFTLLVEGTTLRPTHTVAFLRRGQVFQRCPQ
jgi:hypothetical protein